MISSGMRRALHVSAAVALCAWSRPLGRWFPVSMAEPRNGDDVDELLGLYQRLVSAPEHGLHFRLVNVHDGDGDITDRIADELAPDCSGCVDAWEH